METIIGQQVENKWNIEKERIYGKRDILNGRGIAFICFCIMPITSRIHLGIRLVLDTILNFHFVMFLSFSLYFYSFKGDWLKFSFSGFINSRFVVLKRKPFTLFLVKFPDFRPKEFNELLLYENENIYSSKNNKSCITAWT